jgi:hypothetical protein
MAEGLLLNIEPPIHGWAIVRLTVPHASLEFAASYTPRDSISDLAGAAVGLAAGVPEQIVTWSSEPVEYEFRFSTTGGRTKLEVCRFLDSRRQQGRGEVVAAVEGDATELAHGLWHGLRRLQGRVPTDEFATAWRHPFPDAVVEHLGKRLRG